MLKNGRTLEDCWLFSSSYQFKEIKRLPTAALDIHRGVNPTKEAYKHKFLDEVPQKGKAPQNLFVRMRNFYLQVRHP